MDAESKNKLIVLLKDALLSEEKAVPIYNRHLESSVFWAGFPEDVSEKIRNTLGDLSRDSTVHKKIVEKILLNLS